MTHEEWLLGELLAVLNGDGGQYAVEHGVEAAFKRGLERHTARQAEVERLRDALGTIHYSFKMGNVISGSMLQTWAEFCERALREQP